MAASFGELSVWLPLKKPTENRDPHTDRTWQLVNGGKPRNFYVGVEKAACVKWLRNEFLLRSPAERRTPKAKANICIVFLCQNAQHQHPTSASALPVPDRQHLRCSHPLQVAGVRNLDPVQPKDFCSVPDRHFRGIFGQQAWIVSFGDHYARIKVFIAMLEPKAADPQLREMAT